MVTLREGERRRGVLRFFLILGLMFKLCSSDGEDPDSLARANSKEVLEGIFAAGKRSLFDVFVEALIGIAMRVELHSARELRMPWCGCYLKLKVRWNKSC